VRQMLGERFNAMKPKELLKPFKKLQWKLTLSYTSVTVGSLIVVVLVLSYLLFSYVLVPYQILATALSPEAWINVASQNSPKRWQHILSQDPIDTELVSLLLQVGDLQISHFDILQIGDLQVRLRTLGEGSVLIVGPDGTLLGNSNSNLVTEKDVGYHLDRSILPGLENVLESALSGSVDPSQVFITITPFEEFYFAIPYFAENGEDVLAISLVHIQDLPTEKDLPANIAASLGKSVLLLLLSAGIIGTIFGAITARGMAKRLHRVSEVTEAWSKGDFSEFIQDPMADEISQLALQLNHMAKQLEELLVKRQDIAVSEERNRLARELHDSAKQEALAASFQLGTALTLYDSDPDTARSHLSKAEDLIDSVRQELTDLIHQLRPDDDGRNFHETLSDYLIGWAHQNDKQANFSWEGSGELSLETKQTIYRIIQEALANIARHSQAETADLSLSFLEDEVELCIQDGGVGFDPQLPRQGIGLKSMRERTEALEGKFRVTSEKGKGTQICATFPMKTPRGENE